MRASRLVSILLLLQGRGRMTADALAAELEVSVRTVYRDVEALHRAGVPVCGEPGRDGGYRLLDGYRTRLTGLTGDEAAALPLATLPGPAADLGLGGAATVAGRKIRAALPEALRRRADHIQQRLHVDPSDWYAAADDTRFLADVADAVWRQRRLHVRYRRWEEPREVERTLEPFGLVLKAGRWYVVARAEGRLRTYRVSQLLDARLLAEEFDRPAEFDLAEHWRASLAGFPARRHRQQATVRLSPRGLARLADLAEPAVLRAVTGSAGRPDAEGWVLATMPIESVRHAHEELLRLGAEVEALAPHALRDLLASGAAELARRYQGRPAATDPR